jgi:uncharacterized protein
MTDALYVVTKAPRVGFAKTRLGRQIGHGPAVALHRAFLKDLSARFSGAPFAFGWYVTPPDAWPEISAVTGDSERVLFQGEGDFAERQGDFFRGAAARGEERTILIGSDVPHLGVGVVEEAFRMLVERDIVFTPTRDGGYCLIGMSGPHADVLRDVPMSTGAELEGVIGRARLGGLSVGLLEPTFDVDEVDDLLRLVPLVPDRPDLAATRAALEALGFLGPSGGNHTRPRPAISGTTGGDTGRRTAGND